MPHQTPPRDPQTGKFLPRGSVSGFSAVETIHADVSLSVPAADLDGSTGQTFGQAGFFEGLELFDYDEVIDRHEVATLLQAVHRIETYITSTQTADGTVRASVELSSAPSSQTTSDVGGMSDIDDTSGAFTVEADSAQSDTTIDVVGPALVAVGHGPITDGTNGVGGAGTPGWAEWQGSVPAEVGEFDPRDNLFVNGVLEHSNVADAAIHCDVQVYHVYGIDEP